MKICPHIVKNFQQKAFTEFTISMTSDSSSRKDMTRSQFHEIWGPYISLGCGGYGAIYKIMEKKTGHLFVIKYAFRPNDVSIENEAGVYEVMKKRGPRRGYAIMHSYGKIDRDNYLILNVLGESMEAYASSVNGGKGLQLVFVIQFGISALIHISYLHSIGFLHRDVKPDNFVCGEPGTEDEDIVHLIDFGVASKFEVMEKNGKRHIPFQKEKKYYPGTKRFGTANQNEGYTATRRDDLESLLYTVVFLFKSKLPWDDLVRRSRLGENTRNEIIDMKRSVIPKLLCQGMPYPVQLFFGYVKSLGAADIPDYEYLKKCLKDAYIEACWVRPAE